MSSLGERLREAREAKGLSIAELSKKTHIMSKQLEGLEINDFSRIPAPIYIKSFIKKFAQQVDLDPVEMVAMYEQYAAASARPPAPKKDPKARTTRKKRGRRKRPAESGLTPIGSGEQADTPNPPANTAPAAPAPVAEQTRLVAQHSDWQAEEAEIPATGPPVAPQARVESAAADVGSVDRVGSVAGVGDVQPRKRRRKDSPSMSAVLAAKVRAFKMPRPKLPAFLRSKPNIPDGPVNVPGMKRPVEGAMIKQFFGLIFAVGALALLIFGVVYLSDNIQPAEGGGVALGDLRTNPVIMDPPAPYFESDE